MTQREIAIAFLNQAGTGKVAAAFSKFVASNFIHHNQYFQGTRDALQIAMEEAHISSPNKSIEIKHCYEDNDTIITHSCVTKVDMQIAVVHIFRFENHQIAELWDLGQIIDKNSPNVNGLF